MEKDKSYFYPDYDDIDFSSDISNRLEFNIDIPKKKGCDKSLFELSSYQIFLENFISKDTPYRGLLVFHGTGTGKTCTAVTIAERYKDYYHDKNRRIIVLASSIIEQGWRNNIYNPQRDSNQCTGSEYVNQIDRNSKNLTLKRNQLINRYYDFNTYGAFKNDLKKVFTRYDRFEKSVARKKKIRYIRDNYSNRLLIIDEVHNLRESSKKDPESLQYIRLVLKYSKNLKLILLSATPMFNVNSEIVDILNLLLINDDRETIDINDSTIYTDETFTTKGKQLLRDKMRGYISYIRGETPDKFPIRLYPDKKYLITQYPKYDIYGKPVVFNRNILKLFKCEFTGQQLSSYSEEFKKMTDQDSDNTRSKILRQISNISYPNIESNYGSSGLKQIFTIDKYRYRYKQEYKNYFNIDNLQNISVKIYNLLQIIKNTVGIVFIYSQYLSSGVIPVAIALEEMGYTRHQEDGKPLLDSAKSKNLGNYILLTGDDKLSPHNKNSIELVNRSDNLNGEIVKIIIGNAVISEGVDFKRIREVHIIEPWYHLNKMEQIIGRAIRYCSHSDLPEKLRNVMVYLYTGYIESEMETVDMRHYRIAVDKITEIGEIETIMRETAIDCELYHKMNVIKPNDVKMLTLETPQKQIVRYKPYDRPFTKICSFTDKCDYKCNSKKTQKKSLNASTFTNDMGRNIYKLIYKYIIDLYSIKSYYKINEIVESVQSYINIDKRIIYLALDNILQDDTISVYDTNHNRGYLIYNNEYYVFQPYNQNHNISYMERYCSQSKHPTHINLKIDKIIKTKHQSSIQKDVTTDLVTDSIYNRLINPIKIKETGIDIPENILVEYNLERLSIDEKTSLLNRIIFDKQSHELNNTIMNYYRYNLIDKNNDIGDTREPVGFFLFNNVKPIYFLKKLQVNTETETLLNDKLKRYTETDEYTRLYPLVYPKLWMFNSKIYVNNKETTYVKIVTNEIIDNNPKSRKPSIPNNKSGKQYIKYGRECDSTTSNKIFTSFLNELLKIAKNDLDPGILKNIEKIDTKGLNRNNGLCRLIEIVCRLLNDKIYYYSYDRFFLKPDIIDIIKKKNLI